VDQFATGTPTQCISIQGGGTPYVGVDPWPNSWFLINRTVKFQAMVKPAFYWNEVTTNFASPASCAGSTSYTPGTFSPRPGSCKGQAGLKRATAPAVRAGAVGHLFLCLTPQLGRRW
jgi:hypothetical protein